MPNYAPFFGFAIQGNIGPFTVYQSKHRKPVWFLTPATSPPPVYARYLQMLKFRHIGYYWTSLTAATKAKWAAIATKANLRISGYNLFVHWYLTHDTAAIETLQRNTGINVLNES